MGRLRVHPSVCIFNFRNCCLNYEDILYSGRYQYLLGEFEFTAAYQSVMTITLHEHHNNYMQHSKECI
jgi:hypothetical protein